MTWRMGDLGDCFDVWAVGKSDHDRFLLLEGLLELADRPLTELPGDQVPDRSSMLRFKRIDTSLESTLVLIRVYEAQGVFDVIDLRDF